jgi:hypothetical protein|tara:strand:+ start:461 stop:997 length:537 start_codon:yes stop_codon:yes gene_type:complete
MNGEYMDQPQQTPMPFVTPRDEYGGSIITLTNPEKVIENAKLTYRSQIEDSDGNIHQNGEPLMNEEGINSVIGQIQTLVNQVTVMSNLNKMEIPMLVEFLGDTLAKDLMMNRIKYDIKSSSSRDKIYFTALTSAFVCMKRAYEEGEKRFWKGSQHEMTTRHEGIQQSSPLKKLMGWGR